MAAIDVSGTRSATVRAIEPTIVASLSEAHLDELATRYPSLWRRIATELAGRLRQRNRFIRVPNQRPQLFVGSSSERLSIAQEIQSGLSHSDMVVRVWTDGVFQA